VTPLMIAAIGVVVLLLGVAVALGVRANKTAQTTLQETRAQADKLREQAERDAAKLRDQAERDAEKVLARAERESESLKKSAVIEGKESLAEERSRLEAEFKDRLQELRRREEKFEQREQDLERHRDRVERREDELDKRGQVLVAQEEELESKGAALESMRQELAGKLERVAQMSLDDARELLLQQAEEDARDDAARIARDVEARAKEHAEYEAKKILANAIQRYAGEYIAERTVTVVQIPDDQMKGRIIGREGRNIRTFEMITGVDLIVDDTPETVVISCHSPLRRQVARVSKRSTMRRRKSWKKIFVKPANKPSSILACRACIRSLCA